MRTSTLKVAIGDVTYYIDDPKLGDGLKATVSVVKEGEPLARILHRHRFNLDSASARDKFAAAAGTTADDLLEVRDRVLDFLAPVPPPSDEPAPEIDPAVHAAAETLLTDPKLLARLRDTVAGLGYAGALTLPVIVFLALVSRFLSRPINLVVGGPSAAGKSFLVELVARLFPADATYALNGMSERALIYTDADLRHRTLIVGEASVLHRDGIGASFLRSIAWEGHAVYITVEKTSDGLRPLRIEKPGPTGFITTSTRGVEAELETRVLSIYVPDDEGATREILLKTASRFNGRRPDEPDLRPWHEAQRILAEEGNREVTIPFAETLGTLYPAKQVRSRRDFSQLVALLQASAILHQRQRERDDDGRIVATEADYRTVYELGAPVFGAIAAEGVTPAVRETVAMVAELTRDPDRPRDDEGRGRTIHADAGPRTVTVGRLATALERDKSAVSRRVAVALRGGFLTNDEKTKGKPYRLRLGDPLPEERPALPPSENVFDTPSATVQQWAESAENPQNHADTADAEANATVVQQCNGAALGVAGVAEVLQSPLHQVFPHDGAENDLLPGVLQCCSGGEGERFRAGLFRRSR
jgi:hypothetical protein